MPYTIKYLKDVSLNNDGFLNLTWKWYSTDTYRKGSMKYLRVFF